VASPDVSVDPERYHSSPLYGVQPEKVHSFVLQPSGQVPRRTIRKVVAPQYRVGPANGLGIYNLGTVRCAIVPLAGHILGLFAWRCNTRYDGPNARGEPCPTLGPSFMQENSIMESVYLHPGCPCPCNPSTYTLSSTFCSCPMSDSESEACLSSPMTDISSDSTDKYGCSFSSRLRDIHPRSDLNSGTYLDHLMPVGQHPVRARFVGTKEPQSMRN
jgi:hypothetical protein